MQKHARYGPPDRYLPPPAAGMCISVFVVAKRGGKILVGIPETNDRWTTEWVSGWLMYSKEEREEQYRKKRLPSTYLWEGEHPDDALRRVMLNQLGIGKFAASSPKVFSYLAPSDWYPGNHHWDLVFVYWVRTTESPKRSPWWREVGFVETKKLREEEFGWNGDLMRDLKILQKDR